MHARELGWRKGQGGDTAPKTCGSRRAPKNRLVSPEDRSNLRKIVRRLDKLAPQIETAEAERSDYQRILQEFIEDVGRREAAETVGLPYHSIRAYILGQKPLSVKKWASVLRAIADHYSL